jgi:GDSL-like Lipase/Acylhydrolase family
MPTMLLGRALSIMCAVLLVCAPSAAAKPTAIVALGDSAASGESAGDYEPGTDQPGNFCHRSTNALIHLTAIGGIDAKLNLACSGARSANLYVRGPGQNGEPAQSVKLAQAAAAFDIKLIFVEVGANDDPQFSAVATDCVTRFVLRRARCGPGLAAAWPGRLAAMKPKVSRAIAAVRRVMGGADPAASYQIVLASYWSPVTDPPARVSGYGGKLLSGCPLYSADMDWAHDTAVPQLSAALGEVAADRGVRFLDFSRSAEGREVCARDIWPWQEWVSGLVYDPSNAGWSSFDAVRQSFHANARGHVQLARCLSEFYGQPASSARCLPGSDGNLHPVP